jgi:hypothetical protein
LDRDRKRHDDPQSHPATSHREQSERIEGERSRERGEERPRVARVAVGPAAVERDERRVLRPSEPRAEGDEREDAEPSRRRGEPQNGGGGGSDGGGGGSGWGGGGSGAGCGAG